MNPVPNFSHEPKAINPVETKEEFVSKERQKFLKKIEIIKQKINALGGINKLDELITTKTHELSVIKYGALIAFCASIVTIMLSYANYERHPIVSSVTGVYAAGIVSKELITRFKTWWDKNNLISLKQDAKDLEIIK